MRVLFTTLPGVGGFHPLVPLAQVLRTAGHEVAFASSRSYCPEIEATGFRCFPAGRDWLCSDGEAVAGRVRDEVLGRGGSFSSMQDFFVDFLLPEMVSDLVNLARSWQTDVVVRDPLEFGGCLAAEHLQLPHVACGPLFCLWDAARHSSPGETAKPDLEGLRRTYGLAPDPDLVMLHRYLCLAFLPPAFVGPGLRIPPTVQFLRPVSFNQSGGEGLPDWMSRLPQQPTVHGSLGTVQHRTPGVFDAILEGLRNEAMNVILTVGRDQDPAKFGPQPQNVHIERYIPHALLLPACDAVVTHGGFSSVIACLNEGLPMVLIPISGDQQGNAERCAALGVGRIIGAAERTPGAIRAAVREVLSEPRYRENAALLRKEIRAMPGPERAVSMLLKLVAEPRGFDERTDSRW